jgi:hypothetical protein
MDVYKHNKKKIIMIVNFDSLKKKLNSILFYLSLCQEMSFGCFSKQKLNLIIYVYDCVYTK